MTSQSRPAKRLRVSDRPRGPRDCFVAPQTDWLLAMTAESEGEFSRADSSSVTHEVSKAMGQLPGFQPEGRDAGPAGLVESGHRGHRARRLEDGNAEVVWCRRLDPARALIRNVPMAESGRGYGDLVLHGGEPKGTRSIEGREVSITGRSRRDCRLQREPEPEVVRGKPIRVLPAKLRP